MCCLPCSKMLKVEILSQSKIEDDEGVAQIGSTALLSSLVLI